MFAGATVARSSFDLSTMDCTTLARDAEAVSRLALAELLLPVPSFVLEGFEIKGRP